MTSSDFRVTTFFHEMNQSEFTQNPKMGRSWANFVRIKDKVKVLLHHLYAFTFETNSVIKAIKI